MSTSLSRLGGAPPGAFGANGFVEQEPGLTISHVQALELAFEVGSEMRGDRRQPTVQAVVPVLQNVR